jgi:hypothetical protein
VPLPHNLPQQRHHTAEKNLLEQVAPRPGFLVCMLNILQLQSVADGVKAQAAIQFKNHVARFWKTVRFAALPL